MSLATTIPRKQAPRLAKPAARYWKGKAPQGITETQSDSDEDEDRDNLEDRDVALDEQMNIAGDESDEDQGMTLRKETAKTKAMNIALKDVSVSKDGQVIVAGRNESGKTELEREIKKDSEEDSEAEESEEESSEEESESEEEKPKPLFRPVFVPKRSRITITERERLAEDTEEALKRKEQEALQRKKESHDLVAESIKWELAEKEKEDDVPDVDDTDGLDPEAEFEEWRLRELSRIKKEKEAELEREQEREEVERRRALPEAQRLKEDLERAKQTRDEKPKKSQKFLQKYWHKGAFHQDMEILTRHDFSEATESMVDVSALPKIMQVKNYGQKSRSKYTHLVDQDTTLGTGGFGGAGPMKSGGRGTETGGCFLCGGPHLKRDCPQLADHTSGANMKPLGERSYRGGDGGYRESRDSRNHEGDATRIHEMDSGYSRSRKQQQGHKRPSQSRSPSNRDSHRRPRNLSGERSVERDYRDKRRRVD